MTDEVVIETPTAVGHHMSSMMTGAMLKSVFAELADDVYATAVEKGWYESKRDDGTTIALIHSELSECLEALRHDNPPSDHTPEFSGAEEELADVVIRIMDFGRHKGWDVAGAIMSKMAFNKTRPHKHGGKKF